MESDTPEETTATEIEEDLPISEEEHAETQHAADLSESPTHSQNEIDTSRPATADSNREITQKPRVPSALTIENVRKYEEETDPVDVRELMAKDPVDNNQVEDESHVSQANEFSEYKPLPPIGATSTDQPKQPSYESPAVKEITRGLKFTGEEYIAVSIYAQTDESWLFQYGEQLAQEESAAKSFLSHPSIAIAATDTSSSYAPVQRRRKVHITSDLSTSEMIDSQEEGGHPGGSLFPSHRDIATPSTIVKSHLEATSELDDDDDDVNPVTEMVITESDGSEKGSRTTGTSTTISSVGPPRILQYKPESKSMPINYADIEKNFPSDVDWANLSVEDQAYYGQLLEELERQRIEAEESANEADLKINIEPHAAYGTQQEKKFAKEQAAEKMRVHEVERQKQTVATNQTNFYAFARQLKTVNYSLSSDKCMEEGWTIRPITPPTPPDPAKEFFVQDLGNDIVSGKRYRQTFVYKHYESGQKFLAVFADGTGTVWYPSGNVAITILASEKRGKLIYILQEDKDIDELPSVQATFQPNGNCVCYYPSGVVRVLLSAFGGEYFSEQGERTKKWRWKDTETHVHAPPFQPITVGVSKQSGLRILGQESVFLTFTDGRRSVRFNVGTRLRLKQALPKLEPLDMDAVMLQEKVAYVQSLIERIQYTNKFPNSPRLAKLRLPNYLSAKLARASRMRALLEEQMYGEKPPKKKPIKKVSSSNHSLKQAKQNAAQNATKNKRQLPTKEAQLPVSVTVN